MNKEDIQHLGSLARIKISPEEMEIFSKDIPAILDYVSTIKKISSEKTVAEVGVRYNVLRKDEVLNEPDSFSENLLAEMPKTEGRFLVVKKILNTDSE